MDESDKVSYREIVEIFDGSVPVEAINFLWDPSTADLSNNQIREKLKEFAKIKK